MVLKRKNKQKKKKKMYQINHIRSSLKWSYSYYHHLKNLKLNKEIKVKDELLFILALEHQPSLDSGIIAKH